MKYALKKFAPGKIECRGEIASRMNLTKEKILRHMNIDHDFLLPFQQRKTTDSGAFIGYGMLLDAVAKGSADKNVGKEMLPFKEKRIAELISTQKSDGSISIFPEGNEGTWDNHEQAYIIIAFINDFRIHGNKESLDSAIRLGQYMMQRKTKANIAVDEALIMLYNSTGDESFLKYCLDELKLDCDIGVYDSILPVNGSVHVYTYIARLIAQLEFLKNSNEIPYNIQADIDELYSRILKKGCSSISGSCTGGQYWGEIWDSSQIGQGRWGETCASAYLMRFSSAMLEMHGESVYADLYERIMYNALFAAQSEDGINQRYFVPFNEEGKWYEKDTYCCPNNFKRIIFEIPSTIYMEAEDGIVVNLYESSSLKTSVAGIPFAIEQTTRYPESEEVFIEINTESELKTALYLRVPAFCKDFTVSCGNEVFRGRSGSYLKIDRKWNEKTCLQIRIGSEICFIKGHAAQENKAAIMKGPLVYGINPDLNKLHWDELDCMFFDLNSKPSIKDDGISQNCRIKIRNEEKREILFSRFSTSGRSLTYLPFKGECNFSEDELYS